ncbi:hypothetical protein H0O00_01585 [Candidatus Micrarchaeota archaeon]|nr:hypothetical protein [Candidatus Micrarchaeota archaeon]
MAAKPFRLAVRVTARGPPCEPDSNDPATTSLMHAGSLGDVRLFDLALKPKNRSEAKRSVPADFRNVPKPEPDRSAQ